MLLVYTDRSDHDLFCSTVDLQDSIDNPTTFCVISGNFCVPSYCTCRCRYFFIIMKQISIYVMLVFTEYILYYLISSHTGVVFYHVLLQLLLWWLFHVTMLFWNIRFPLHARVFEETHPSTMKCIHIACVTLALLVPWIPVIAAFATGGFFNASFPPELCTGRNADATFYSLVVPLIIMMQIGVTMLIVIFWTLHKVWYYAHALTWSAWQLSNISFLHRERAFLP